MSFSYLRLLSVPLRHHVAKRHLSATETAVALRPFYFAVHPDLFGRHPKERAVNEESLKRLKEYLDHLHDSKRVRPATLTFYIRDTDGAFDTKRKPVNLREVRIALLSVSIHDTVKKVLQSCNLSLEYVEGITPTGKDKSSHRPIKWHHTFYDHFGVPNPEGAKRQRKPERTLGLWLSKNVNQARAKLEAIEPIHDRIQILTEELKVQTGLKDIQWANNWSIAQHRVCLIGLSRVVSSNPNLLLEGHTLVFGVENGVCLRGDIILKRDDIAENWLKVLTSVGHHDAILGQLPEAEQKLSALLNNIKVVRRTHHPIILAQEYRSQLLKLIDKIQQYYVENPTERFPADLSDVELVVDCSQGRLSLSPSGQVLVPSSCPAFLITAYLVSNTDEARRKYQSFLQTRAKEHIVIEQVQSILGLRSLSREDNVTAEQMEICCNHLLADPRNLGVRLDGCRVKVALFYSVMSDGEICIPWNWVGAYDEEH